MKHIFLYDRSKNRFTCFYLPRGVTEYWYRGILRFKTQLKIGGKGLYLGLFRDVTSASLAYSNKVKELDIYQYQH